MFYTLVTKKDNEILSRYTQLGHDTKAAWKKAMNFCKASDEKLICIVPGMHEIITQDGRRTYSNV
jgi:hypothetical protein